MSNPLKDFILNQIRTSGPMDVGQFMSACLGHPEYGYYMKQDPLGRGGDFTTAPEVSQMFGEMIGVWLADMWMQMGAPDPFILLECGPGRGTLMADILRATKGVQGFHEAVQVYLVEISPALKAKQEEALSAYDVSWCGGVEDVPDDAPIFMVANEFLDALPFRQMAKLKEGWGERVVGEEDGVLVFTVRPAPDALAVHIPENVIAKEGDVFEISPARENFVRGVCARIKAQDGAALFIDYGHIKRAVGDTFQAVKNHEYVDVLADAGDADLTSHVDFAALKDVEGVNILGPVPQGAFLKALGVEMRAQALSKGAGDEAALNIQKDLQRLYDSDQMGELFKVIGYWYHHDKRAQNAIKPAGF